MIRYADWSSSSGWDLLSCGWQLAGPACAGSLRGAARQPAAGSATQDEEFRYRAALSAIRDLDFDYRTGKLDAADYQVVRRQLLFEAAHSLPHKESGSRPATPAAGVRLPPARHSSADGAACRHCGARLDRSCRYCPQCGSLLERTCANCGEELDQADQHCAACGEPVPARIGDKQ